MSDEGQKETAPTTERKSDIKPFIAKVVGVYFDEKGQRIEEIECVSGEMPEDQPRFLSSGRIMSRRADGQVEQLQFQFGINAQTVEEAFEKMEAEGSRVGHELLRQRQMQSSLLLPQGARRGPANIPQG